MAKIGICVEIGHDSRTKSGVVIARKAIAHAHFELVELEIPIIDIEVEMIVESRCRTRQSLIDEIGLHHVAKIGIFAIKIGLRAHAIGKHSLADSVMVGVVAVKNPDHTNRWGQGHRSK